MIATTAPEKLYTVEEYLAFEKRFSQNMNIITEKLYPCPAWIRPEEPLPTTKLHLV